MEKWLTQMIGTCHPVSSKKQQPHRQHDHDFRSTD